MATSVLAALASGVCSVFPSWERAKLKWKLSVFCWVIIGSQQCQLRDTWGAVHYRVSLRSYDQDTSFMFINNKKVTNNPIFNITSAQPDLFMYYTEEGDGLLITSPDVFISAEEAWVTLKSHTSCVSLSTVLWLLPNFVIYTLCAFSLLWYSFWVLQPSYYGNKKDPLCGGLMGSYIIGYIIRRYQSTKKDRSDRNYALLCNYAKR